MKETKIEMTPGNIFAMIVLAVIVISIVAIVIFSSISSSRNEAIVNDVSTAIDNLDSKTRTSVATTSGRVGDITKVSSGAGNDVNINVSTYYETPDEGKIIARNIFNVVCSDVPELNSLYVTSGQGLDSYSIYRSESACKY